MVTLEEATEQVQVMARRVALLYHYTAEVLVEQFGEEKGRELLREIIWRYGSESGVIARTRVEELGLPVIADNFKSGSDLPKWGWQGDAVLCDDGEVRARVTYCPFAEVWKEKGSQALGRLYCLVDEAKYDAFNGSSCRHLKNVLDGDDCCLFDIKEQ
jgi:hypothetical protein